MDTPPLTWWQRRKIRKHAQHTLHHAHTLRSMKEGTWSTEKTETLATLIQDLRAARKTRDPQTIQAATQTLEERCAEFAPPPPWAPARDLFDTLVVALSVAFAFRAYYYQPFKIPTGSMQPTLYGIHTLPPAEPTLWDTPLLKFPKWLLTGTSYTTLRAKAVGTTTVTGFRSDSPRKPGYAEIHTSTPHIYHIPTDSLPAFATRNPPGKTFRQGDIIWKGHIRSGDFLFVNRWIWNFRHPRRGEVMVFSTRNIPSLPPNTHYIKRMTGTPGDTLSIATPNLLINGAPLHTPPRIDQIARLQHPETAYAWAPPYAGFNTTSDVNRHLHALGYNQPPTPPAPGRLVNPADTVTLPPLQYYAMGDNTFSSLDSRYWGPVPARNLLGPATFVHWPFTSPRWGNIE